VTTLVQHLVALALGVVAVARAVRLVTSDTWPPMARVREWWKARTAPRDADGTTPLHDQAGDPVEGPWTALLTCPFCFAPYAAAVDLAWYLGSSAHRWVVGDWTGAGWWWWVVNGWAAVAYLAAMVVLRDEPPPVDE
jgi:hypothetical protein